jgi:V/A-type H+-transporting ATPase subunit D
MARIALNKAELARRKAHLAQYRRYLPALDLKRRQLIAERNAARVAFARLREAAAAKADTVGDEIPMLADGEIGLDGLVRVTGVRLSEQNVVGVRLPVLDAVETETAPYGWLVRPHWVDRAAERLAEALQLEIAARVAERRLALLEEGVRRITQRVNLFDKVLIPQTREAIRRIGIHLGDAERAAVVRAKFAKKKREAA